MSAEYFKFRLVLQMRGIFAGENDGVIYDKRIASFVMALNWLIHIIKYCQTLPRVQSSEIFHPHIEEELG